MTARRIASLEKLIAEQAEKGTYFVGVFGPAGLGERAVEGIDPLFRVLLHRLRELLDQSKGKVKNICIVNNGTSVGVPGMVVRLASLAGFPLLGICPELAMKQKMVRHDLLNWLKVVGEDWGDEERAIIKTVQAIVFLGGEYGTLSLLADVMNRNYNTVNRLKKAPIPVFALNLPQTENSLVFSAIEELFLRRLGAEELSRLGVAAPTSNPHALAGDLLIALEAKVSSEK